MDCSIVICTRNRADSLRQTLVALGQQVYGIGALEILVVDNGSTDHTRRVVDEVRARDSRLRYVVEPTPGLSVARNTGVAAAHGDVVAFLDDDAWPARPDWAERLASVYEDDRVAAAGGDVELDWPGGGQPAWLDDRLLPCLGKTDFDFAETTALPNAHGLWGVNLSFRRARITPPNGFRPHLGHVDETPGAGEEVELCRRLVGAGARVVYVPDAPVVHAVAPETLTGDWFRASAWTHGRADADIARIHASAAARGLVCLKRIVDALLQIGAIAVYRLTGARRARLRAQYRLRYSTAYLLGILGR